MFIDRSRFVPALLGGVLLIAACGGSDSPSAESSQATDPVASEVPATEPMGTDSESVCGIANDEGDFEKVSCDDPHDSEFAGVVATPSGNAPLDGEEYEVQLGSLCAPAVEALVSRPTFPVGVEVRFVSSAAAGEPFSGDIECWASINGPGALVASIATTDLATALGEYELVEEMAVGTCFALPSPETVGIGRVVPCSDNEGEMLFAVVDFEDGEYPGEDQIIDDGSAKCDEAALSYEATIDDASIFVSYPFEVAWTDLGLRTGLCTALVSGVEFDESADTSPESDSSETDLVDIEEPAGFVFGAADPVCSIVGDDGSGNEAYFEASCDEPHNAELVALIEPPGETLPDDGAEAVILFYEMCLAPVTEATGADLFRPGVAIGFNVAGSLGEAYEGPIACYATFGSVGWVGSFQDLSLAEVLDGQVIIADLDPGDCFVFAEDAFNSGYEASCDEPGALMSVGQFEAADQPSYPGGDALRAERAIRCGEILTASGLMQSGVAGDPATLSGTFPEEGTWNVPGLRVVTCDIEPA